MLIVLIWRAQGFEPTDFGSGGHGLGFACGVQEVQQGGSRCLAHEPARPRMNSWENRQKRSQEPASVCVSALNHHQCSLSLAYLGLRNFILIDRDSADETNLNRLVTATPADVGTPKAYLGRRLVRSLAQDARVLALPEDMRSSEAIDALKGADVIFGCLDNDGGRLILNELALAYGIPYFDLASGIDARDGTVRELGGRVCVVLLGGPCLNCMGEIDPLEARYHLATPEQRNMQVRQGYVSGMDVEAPSVVSINAAVTAAAVNEFAVFVSGIRPLSAYTELDLLGIGRSLRSQWTTPRRVDMQDGCVQCLVARPGG